MVAEMPSPENWHGLLRLLSPLLCAPRLLHVADGALDIGHHAGTRQAPGGQAQLHVLIHGTQLGAQFGVAPSAELGDTPGTRVVAAHQHRCPSDDGWCAH